jgi:hypothetical protein
MTRPRDVLRTAHEQLRRDRVIEVDLESLEQLTTGDGDAGAGFDVLVGILDSAVRLPDRLVVRVSLPEGRDIKESDVKVFHEHCRALADETWREAVALRNGGIRELPRALILSVGAGALGVVSGTLAQGSEQTLLAVLLYAVAFMAVIAAWTIGWAPIEQATFDWRAPAHTTAVYELLSQARVEAVPRLQVSGPVPSAA